MTDPETAYADHAPVETPNIKHNKEISIAVAKNRFAKKWKNTTITIAEFITKLSFTTRTAELYSDFVRMPKGDQDDIKDVGAFVGGTLKRGRRRKDSVANRHVITLDMDYGTVESIDTIKHVLRGCCYTIYSTHKHSPEKPRLRIIVYPDRPMLPDEYQAVARKVAAKVGIEQMDDSSYDINRLFYWPSCSSDAEFVYYHNDAEFLSVNRVLDAYGPNELWRDVTNWPTSSRETLHVNRMVKKQVNPLTKKNIVGAWCRNVSIIQALDEHLHDVYRKEPDGRYTYIEGTTSKGVVVYDNKFVYSHHSSDPAHGQTCNAWDIVRIHKFGHVDTDHDLDSGASGTKLQSYKEMAEFAQGFAEIKTDLIKSGLEIGPESFDEFGVGDDGEDWSALLQIGTDKKIKSTWHNLKIILKHDPKLKNMMRLNKFTEKEEVTGGDGETWTDHHSSKVKAYLGQTYEVDPPANKLEEVISYQAARNSYHPVQEYLEGLTWDGKSRVETLFIDYLGCDDNLYTRMATQCWFSAAVHRIFHPGHKFDYVPVFEGPQGIMKSTFIRTLAKGKWFGNLTSFDSKIAMEEITGKWVIEMDELSATSKQELEQQKAFLSAQSTTVRMAYARRSQEFHRQCVFIGTTNNKEYLKDSTGNRRWWPYVVNVTKIDVPRLEDEIDQVWAEAYASLYAVGYRTYLNDEAEVLAKEIQAEKRVSDPWEGIILEWLEIPAPKDRYDAMSFDDDSTETRDKTCSIEIWREALEQKGDPRPSDRMRISAVMDNASGWKRIKSIRFGTRYGRQRGWIRTFDDTIPF